jgi:hypothetical protein
MLKGEAKEFLAAKRQCLKLVKLDTTRGFPQETAKVVEATYEVSLLIVKAKKACTVEQL